MKIFKFGIYLDIIVEYFLRIILYKYIYKINFKIQIDTQIREIMAAGDEFPLEVILIIVAVIVVLFIAIFFGSLISTRLRKRKVFAKPAVDAVERSGGAGDGGDGGGGASKGDGPPALLQPLPPPIKYREFMEQNIDKQKLINIIKSQLYYINNSMHSGFGKDTSGVKTGSETGSDIRFKNFVNLFKHLNLTQEQRDNIRQNIISDIFDKDIPLTTITINAKDPADNTRKIPKDIKVPDDNEYIRLSMALINEFEKLSIKTDVSELYKKTYDYINATIATLFKSLENIKSGNRKQEVVKLINKSKKLTDLYLISPLLKSEYIVENSKQDLLLKNALWQNISIYNGKIADKKNRTQISPKITALFTSSAKTLDNLFGESTDITTIIKYITEEVITGPWDKMFDCLKKLDTNTVNIVALVKYIGYQCLLNLYTINTSREVGKQKKSLELTQAQNNKNIKSILDDTVNVLKPKTISYYLWSSRVFKEVLSLFIDIVQPLNKIVEFTGSKADLADHKTKLADLKTTYLDKIKANLDPNSQILTNIYKFANNKYTEYSNLLDQLTNATKLFTDLKNFVGKNNPKTNYDTAEQLYLKGIDGNTNHIILQQNLDNFKQYIKKQSEYSKIASDLKQIYNVLPKINRDAIKPMITRAERYYGKFYELLNKIHKITEKYHGEYGKIMGELRKSLDNSSPIDVDIIDNSGNMRTNHEFATVVSTASKELAQTLGIHNITDQKTVGYILNKSIDEKYNEITVDHKSQIGQIATDIPVNLQAQISSVTGQIQSETKTLDTNIEKINEEKDKIIEYINASILADTVPQADALKNIDIANQRISDLQKTIDNLIRIDPNQLKDIINAAGRINPTISVVDLESAIKTNNDTHDAANNYAKDCTVAISDGAIKIATDTYDKCIAKINALPIKEVNTIINYITGLISINPLYARIVKYVEIAAKIGDTNTEYKDILEKRDNLRSELEKLSKDVNTYILDIFNLSAYVTTASDELNSINSVAAATTAIDIIKQIQSGNNQLLALFNTINTNSTIMSYVGFDSAKLRKSMLDNIALVDEILNKSTQAKHDAEIEETKLTTAAAIQTAKDAADLAQKAKDNAAALAKQVAEDAAKEAAKKLKAAKAAADDKAKADAYKLAVQDLSAVFDTKAAKYNTNISNYLTSITAMKATNADIITNAKNLGDNLETLVESVLDITITKPDIGNMKLKQTETEKAIEAAILDTHTNDITKSEDDLILAVNGDGTNPGYLALLKSNVDIIKDEYKSFNNAAFSTMSDSIYNTAISAGLAKIKANEDNLDKLYNDDAVAALETIMKPANDAIKTSNDAFVAACDSFIKTKDFAVAASKKISAAITQINTNTEDTVNKYDLTPVDRIKGDIDAIVPTISVDAAIAYANVTAIKTESDTYITADLRDELNSVKDTVNSEHTKSLRDAHSVNLATIEVTSADPISKLPDLIKALDNVIATYNNITGTINPIAQIQQVTDKITKLNSLKDIAELMKDIDNNHTATNTARVATKTASDATKTANDEVIRIATEAQTKSDEANNIEQTAIALIGSINDRVVTSELNKLKRTNADIKKLNRDIRRRPADPLNKSSTAKASADVALASADSRLNTFTAINPVVLYTQDLAYWKINYGGEHVATKAAVVAAKTAAETAKASAETAKADAEAALAVAQTKIDNINPKIPLINTIFITIKQLIDDINNESDDDTKEQSITQPDDDKVKPFSHNSYDILPLDPKVATLSSNMQFSESKSTATNNPGNSFMYTIVPYDSQELSSDDRVLEIVSFARTQRMPIKDAANIIVKAGELLKKYRGTKKVIPGAWVYRGGKLFTSVKPTKIEELERYIELMRRSLAISDGLDRGSRSGGGTRKRE